MGHLEDTVRAAAAKVGGPDVAAVELAVTYARAIDDGGDVDKTGPLLLAVLESLQMTPRARAGTPTGGTSDTPANPLDELRARRDARVNDPAPVDTTAP